MKFRRWISVLLMTISALSGCHKHAEAPKPDALFSAYDTEPDWTDAQKIIPLSYQQAQGKRIFFRRRNPFRNCFYARRRPAALPSSRPSSVAAFREIGDTHFEKHKPQHS